jgi:hypothetical protein
MPPWNVIGDGDHDATVQLPAGQFGSIQMLASAEGGSQETLEFQVNYSDGTSGTFTQSVSDWNAPQDYPGETTALSMPYSNDMTGAKVTTTVYLYNYGFSLDNCRAVASFVLPKNGNLNTLALTLVPSSTPCTTQYQLTTSASPAAGGSVMANPPSASGLYQADTVVTLTATANPGYQFTGWNGPVASAGSTSTTVTMSAAETVTANFTTSAHPPFFTGETSVGSNLYYLQFPDSNLFGYYGYLSSSILYHVDMGYEAFVASGASIYFYDFASTHWWYSSASLFPNLYDFTLGAWIYYFPDTKNSGHYTTNPRYFVNLTTQKIFTM